MKITANNGKKIITMNKSEWQMIGKQAGWDATLPPETGNEYEWAKTAIIERLKKGMEWDKAIHGYVSRLNPDQYNQLISNKEQIINEAKTITAKKKTPKQHGFIDQCMKENDDKDNPGAYCASIVDKVKGTTDWRKDKKKKD